MPRTPGDYECQEYSVRVAGRTVRLLGPKYPHALHNDPDVRRRHEQDGYSPYWALPFPASVMLAEHVIAHVPPAADPVLELGAGLGLAGIALSLAGFAMVITDYDEDALAFVRASAKLNGAELRDVRPLDWRTPPPERYALIVGADIIYQPASLQPVAALLAGCLAPGGRAFISDGNRSKADEFPAALRAAGLNCETVKARARAIPAFDAIDDRMFDGRIFCISW